MESANAVFTIADLCDAAATGDVDHLRTILDRQPDLINVMVAENNEHRAIHYAVLNGQDEAVRLLVQQGAKFDVGIYPHRSATGALTMAEERGLDSIVEIMRDEDEKRTLAACENIEISPENDALFAAMTGRNSIEALRILDHQPGLLNACHRHGGSVLYTAACAGLYDLVHLLLERGADYRHLTPSGASALDGAVQNARPRALPLNEGCLIAAGILLQAGCNVTVETAVILGDIGHVQQASLDQPERFANDGIKRLGLLQRAVEVDNIDMVRLLLQLGCHPDDEHELIEYENRPKSGGEPLTSAAGSGQYEIALLLLEAGADPNKGPYASGNPVGQAYNSRDEKMKGLLFRYGGVLEASFAGLEGETAAAAVYLHKDPELAENLLWAAGCGGDINLSGLCLRHLNWESDDDRWMRLLEQPIRLWRLHPHREFKDVDRGVYPEIFRMIIEHGASPNVVGRFGYRLAHHLAATGTVWGRHVVMLESDRIAFARILVEHDAHLNVLDDLLLSTPLGWAVRWNRYELAEFYLQNGAVPDLSGAEWSTPRAWAEKQGNDRILELIHRYR
jgi:ankyrin repeat protein